MDIVNYIKYISAIFFFLAGNVIAADNCTTEPTSSLVVNIKEKGAKGDGITDDTAAIQAAVKQVAGTDGTVLIPAGTYMIDAITGILIQKKMTFRMAENAVLKAIPNGKAGYSIINVIGVSNVNIIGGTLIGERDEHTGISGEWGMGITLRGAENVALKGVTVKNAWGDGFYIAGTSKNVKFCSVIADNNRRQGMSIISVDGMIVNNSIFKNTGGTAPQAGIDIEPNKNDTVSNVQISNSQFINNKGPGILLYVANASDMRIENTIINGNSIIRNQSGGLTIANTFGHKITNNVLADNNGIAILLDKRANNNIITKNKIKGRIKSENGNAVFDNIQE